MLYSTIPRSYNTSYLNLNYEYTLICKKLNATDIMEVDFQILFSFLIFFCIIHNVFLVGISFSKSRGLIGEM